jgi:PIN domain nuclease of toxin-antitoxin system
LGGIEIGSKLLLDTHIFLWVVTADKKLGRKTKRLLEKADTEIWLSPITLWECLMLDRAGRVRLEPTPLRWVRDAIAEYPFREAPLNHEVALETRSISLEHEDPADRFLAATAAVYSLTLLTADERLLEGSGFSVIANE